MAKIHKVGIIGYGGMGRGWHPERMKDLAPEFFGRLCREAAEYRK